MADQDEKDEDLDEVVRTGMIAPALEIYPFQSVVDRLVDLPAPPTQHQILEALQQDNRERLAEISDRPVVGGAS